MFHPVPIYTVCDFIFVPIHVNGNIFYEKAHGQQFRSKNKISNQELRQLRSLTLSRDVRDAVGYPRFISRRKVEISPTIWERGKKMWIFENEKTRMCSYCKKPFQVLKDGSFAKTLCQTKDSSGLIVATNASHVTAQRFSSELCKFAGTPRPLGDKDIRSRMVYAIDCEMVFTTAGPALARLTVVDFGGQTALEMLVKPAAPIIDPCTKFSGLTMETMATATETLESCREKLFKLVNSETILIGHSLNNDLNFLRVVHGNVIDTSLMYAASNGDRVALRHLAKQHLGRKIQCDNAETLGHCSKEDALASLDLVKLKLRIDNSISPTPLP